MKIGQSESIEVWDAGLYAAKVAGVEETVSSFPGKEGTPRLKVILQVASEDGDETTEVWYWVNPTLSTHVKATFRPFVKAVIPELDIDAEIEADPTWTFDTDDLIGKRCRVILGINEEKGRNTIEKVMPAEAKKRKVAAPVEEVEDDEAAPPARQPVGAGAGKKSLPF